MKDESPPPLVGYNNNVRYRGQRFHIQTEDSGARRPYVTTHLFADGGHVIKSQRTDYSEHAFSPDRAALVRQIMRDQHRAMALSLRDGRLDTTIAQLASAPAPAIEGQCDDGSESAYHAASRSPKTSIARGELPPPTLLLGAPELGAPILAPPPVNQGQTPALSTHLQALPIAIGHDSATPVLQRRALPQFASSAMPEESLDDVILGYMGNAPVPPQRK